MNFHLKFLQSIMDILKIRKTWNNPALIVPSDSVVYDLTFLPHFPGNILVCFNDSSISDFPFSNETKHFQVIEASCTGRIENNALTLFLKATVSFTPTAMDLR